MALSLGITIGVEALVAWGWCRKHGKPIRSILLTGLAGNVLTQGMLWGLLMLSAVRHYRPVLLLAETGIWAVEGALLALMPANRLGLGEALRLSLWMNLASFGLGLGLPV